MVQWYIVYMNSIQKELIKKLDEQKHTVSQEIIDRCEKARALAKARNIKPTPKNIFTIMQELKGA